MRTRPAFLATSAVAISVGVLLVLALAPRSGAPMSTAAPPAAATTPPGAAAPAPSPTEAGLLSATYGLIVMSGTSIVVRSETDAREIAVLDRLGEPATGGAIAVSGDGRRVALWPSTGLGRNELRLWQASAPDRIETLLISPEGERGTGIAWAADGSGLVLSFDTLSRLPGFHAGPDASYLRTYDLATRQTTEVVRIPRTSLVPLAWDRAQRTIAAFETGGGGFARSYVVVRDGAVSRTELLSERQHTVVPAVTTDAAWVVVSAHVDSRSRLIAWPLSEPTRTVQLGPDTDRWFVHFGWLHGQRWVIVGEYPADVPPGSVPRLSLWDPARDARSPIPHDPVGGVASRPDGSGIYLLGTNEASPSWIRGPAAASRSLEGGSASFARSSSSSGRSRSISSRSALIT